MKELARLLGEMTRAGVIKGYAIFGAAAQMRYTEAVVTLDVDVLVAVPEPVDLAVIGPMYAFCRDKGYQSEGEAIRVGAWPVQFIPAFDEITKAAVLDAEEENMEGEPLRVVRADYLAIIALKLGRAKDWARILALLEADAVSAKELEALARTYGLSKEWEGFQKRFLHES